ncbi:esterase B1-like isoform X1 [Drosophila guanche]|uniref:carboxylesterase n=2 Tax=Drosophila guanche TaxID=7266 RepID=A0A3B0JPF0_DROGU|nr:esterase B1-like isoform X1 [Drosophila guanche]SPP84097.1 blast:Esterase B1 [Drosophila guanche]
MERSDGSILVQTESGPVVGRRCTGVYGDEYVSFEGIPYARPPVGRLRFMAPLAVTPWTEPLDCRSQGPKPLQFNHYSKKLEGVEDSLHLNVYAKELKSAKPLPLIVFFFGGGFEKGDPTTDLHGPDYFMMQDVVVVTISYRVGPLGFLLLNDPAVGVPGNAGLKDQVLGLQWITANAASFNADPNNVTAFGESAGAASVHYLMLNPKAEGLFHKAILQSGNVLCTWAQCPITDMPQRLAGNLGMENANTATDAMILDYLQALPGEQLVKPYLLSQAEHMDDCLFQFGPMVEPYKTEHCVLPKPPSELLSTAWGNKIPLLMSGTSFEGLLMYARVFVAPYLLTSLKDQPEHMLPREEKRARPRTMARSLGQRLRALHFGESALAMSPEGVLAYCEYASYKVFWLPILRVIRSRLRQTCSCAPTYLYRFDFDSPTFNHQRIKYVGDKLRGVAHVDDHSYLWFGSFAWKLDKHTPEYLTIERMIDIVTSFARSSNPNCPKVAEQLPRTKEWLPLDSRQSTVECLNISDSIKMIELPELQKLSVWESICKIKD